VSTIADLRRDLKLHEQKPMLKLKLKLKLKLPVGR
jgi:hypothetical protein